MIHLMIKDLKVSAPISALILLLYLLHAPINFHLSGGYLLVGVGFSLTLACVPILVDWHFETEAWLRSLPFSRETMVRARFGTAAIALIAGLILTFGFAAVLDRWLDPATVKAASLLSLQGGVVFIAAVALPLVFFFPVYFAAGPGKALPVLIAVGFLLAVAPFGLGRASTVHSVEPREQARHELLSFPEKTWVEQAHAVRTRLGSPLFAVLAGTAFALIVGGSLQVSIRLYRRRDL